MAAKVFKTIEEQLDILKAYSMISNDYPIWLDED